jgi:hypothetical protein
VPRDTLYDFHRPVAWSLAFWFLLALLIGASGIYERATAVQVAATVWGLVAIVCLAIWAAPFVRSFAVHASFQALIALQVTRFVGIALVALYLRGRLPYSFGMIGGAGDIAVAAGAVAILWFWKRTGSAPGAAWIVAWNVFGLVDILGVVASAFREGLRDATRMAPLRECPLSLLPTFLVPLIIVSHGLIFTRFRRAAGR